MRVRLSVPSLAASAVLIALALSSIAAPVGAAPPPPAPPEFADLYSMLDGRLKAIDRHISSRWGGERHDVIFSAELLAANSNQGEKILGERGWQVVLFNLDRLQPLGIRGVKVALKYPILVPGFPRSADYLEFFKKLSTELRRRNINMLAQMTAGFREPVFSDLPVAGHYSGLTLERYKREKRQMAELIIREVRPDFLTIENEPHTQQENTGLPFTVRNFTEIVEYMLDGLDRRGVQIGAGAGTWDDLAYVQALARTPVDYIDMHIYPINRDFVVDKAFRIADVARRASKKLALGEAWLYKSRDAELGGQSPVAAAPVLYSRDVFGFWQPLDVEFITAMVKLAHHLKIDFVSFFWSRHFHGYVEYGDSTRTLPPGELFRRANLAAAKGMAADPPQLTLTGQAFQRLIRR